MAQRLALVLSGGGNAGICQVPFLQHLMDIGVRPDMIVGTSVGALNGAFLAFHPSDIHGLADIWRALRDRRMWDRNLLQIGRNLLRGSMSLYNNQFIRDLIAPYATVDEIAAADIPLYITAASLNRGVKHVFSRGSVVDAVLASCAVPGLFPPVQVEGEWFVDAGVVTGLDLETAVMQGATQIIAVDLGAPPSPRRPRGIIDVLARSMEVAVEQRTRYELDHLSGGVPTVVWRPGLRTASAGSFAEVNELYHAAQGMAPALIDQSRREDGSWIAGVYHGAVPVGEWRGI